jgi:predicted nucleic acid-binding protein
VIVADTNLVVYLLVPGQFTEAVKALYAREGDWVAPFSWRAEFLNVMSTYCRDKKLSIDQAVAAYYTADKIVADVPIRPDPRLVFELSMSSGCAGYDTLFVATAKMNSLPLITFDQALHKAFPDTAIRPEALEAWWQQHRKGKK